MTPEVEQANNTLAGWTTPILAAVLALLVLGLVAALVARIVRGARGHGDDPCERRDVWVSPPSPPAEHAVRRHRAGVR